MGHLARGDGSQSSGVSQVWRATVRAATAQILPVGVAGWGMSERAQALEAAIRKILAHTSYNAGAGRGFLAELLASVERIADAALAGEAPAVGVSPQPDLHAAIMNLPMPAKTVANPAGYREGFKDARHGAAELASAYLSASLSPVEPTPSSINCPLCGEDVQQVSSASLSLALSQHVLWPCRRTRKAVEPTPEPPRKVNRDACTCGGIMFGDGHAHSLMCPCFEASPTVEPEPCIWREEEEGEGRLRRTVMRTACGLREDADEMRPLSEWPFCPQCGKPLRIDR